MITLRNLIIALIAMLTFLFPQALMADFYVIPIKPKTAGPGCVAYHGLEYCEIVSAKTARTWLDRNLGSPKVCSAYNDSDCYGDYYQWGRYADGHEKSDSQDTTTQAASLVASEGTFIKVTVDPYDWVESGVDDDGSLREANWNPCPSGYRVPTVNELDAENIAYSTPTYVKLKLPSAGYRDYSSGSMYGEGTVGYVWSASLNVVSGAWGQIFGSGGGDMSNYSQAKGLSVRCLKE